MDNLHEIDTLLKNSLYYHLSSQFTAHVHGRVLAALDEGDRMRDALDTPAALAAYRERMRAAFLAGIGGLPPCDTPLNPQRVGIVTGEGFRVEKVIIHPRPHAYLTGNLYIPDGVREPTAAVIFCCGHDELAKTTPEYQCVCRHLVNAGFVVFTFDPIGQGDRKSYFDAAAGRTTVRWGTGEHDYAGAQCWPLGDGIARYFLHDAMRVLDYLAQRPEVDPARIGITGNSGGGYQTSLMMLCDPRIAAAVPGTYITSRRDYLAAGEEFDAEQIFPEFGALGFEHEDFLIGMAPKPVLVLAVDSDFFPIDGTRRTVERCRRFWEMQGRAADLTLFVDESIHCYTPNMARVASAFFARHLLGTEITFSDDAVQPITPSALSCTETGYVRVDFPDARFVYEENQLRLDALEAERTARPADDRQAQGIEWLREKVCAHRQPVAPSPRHTLNEVYSGLALDFSFWWSQQGIMNCACTFRNLSLTGAALPVTIAVWNGGTKRLSPHMRWIRRECDQGRAVMVLDVTGVGQAAPYPINRRQDLGFVGTTCMLAYDLLTLGDSLPALRTWDVLRAIDVAGANRTLDASDIALYGHGPHALYARLAAVLDARVRQATYEEDMPSWTELVRTRHYEPEDIMSIIFPGALAHIDLPELPGINQESRPATGG